MPQFFDRIHFVAIAHLLTAGDVATRIVQVGESYGIEVSLVDGDKVVWSNARSQNWSYTRVVITDDSLTSGQQKTFKSPVTWDAMPESVAELIATHDYGVALVAPE